MGVEPIPSPLSWERSPGELQPVCQHLAVWRYRSPVPLFTFSSFTTTITLNYTAVVINSVCQAMLLSLHIISMTLSY